MSTSQNLKALHTKLATIQQTRTPCSYFCKGYPKASARKSLKIQASKPMIKWSRKPSASQHHSKSSMHYTNDQQEMPHSEQTSRMPDRHRDSTSTTQTLNNSDRGLDKPLLTLTPQPCPNLGTTNPFWWTSTEQEPQEETGEVKGEDRVEEMSPEWMTSELKGEYRVHALTADNKDTLLVTAPPGQNAPTLEQPSW